MPRAKTTKSDTNDVATVENTVATDVVLEENKETEEVKTAVKTIKVEENESVEVEKELKDSDEIMVISFVPNVSYRDSANDDYYEWAEIDHEEPMTYEAIKRMWRGYKGYFKNMILKPLDDRVVKKLGLTSVYEKYEFLMDEKSYTRENIGKIIETLSKMNSGTKISICNKVKNLIIEEKITDVKVIKEIGKYFDMDLSSYID